MVAYNGPRLWALAASLLAQPRSSFENESINLNDKFHLNTKSPLPEAAVVSWGNRNHSSFTLIVQLKQSLLHLLSFKLLLLKNLDFHTYSIAVLANNQPLAWRKRKHGIALRFQLSFIGFLCRTVSWLFLLLVFFIQLWLFENFLVEFTSYHITVQLVFITFNMNISKNSSFSFSSSNRQKENQRITNTQTFIFHELLTSKFSNLT